MHAFFRIFGIAAVATALMTSNATSAVVNAPELDRSTAAASAVPELPILEHRLGEEMTVRNWVLCASEPVAERLVHAREAGTAAAEKAFTDLAAAHSCGRLDEMLVILQKPLYQALLRSGNHAGVYSALISISGAWASGFVVYGGLPSE